jgi:hypothetical protein
VILPYLSSGQARTVDAAGAASAIDCTTFVAAAGQAYPGAELA